MAKKTSSKKASMKIEEGEHMHGMDQCCEDGQCGGECGHGCCCDDGKCGPEGCGDCCGKECGPQGMGGWLRSGAWLMWAGYGILGAGVWRLGLEAGIWDKMSPLTIGLLIVGGVLVACTCKQGCYGKRGCC